MFKDLNIWWKNKSSPKFAHLVHPCWKHYKPDLSMYNKPTCSAYHQMACGNGQFNARLHKLGLSKSNFCRKGCPVEESEQHILYDCPYLTTQRALITQQCQKYFIPFNVENIFIDQC